MNDMQIRMTGGQRLFSRLNTAIDEKLYDVGKAHIWLNLVNEHRERPVKWGKAAKKGTKVEFSVIRSAEDLEAAFDELEICIRSVNRKHGLEMKLTRPEPVEGGKTL